DGVDQHQRKDENTSSPKHEGETGMGCRSVLDRDRERDHVRPERYRQGAERRRENERDHVEGHSIPASPNARGRHECRDDTDRREDKQIRPLKPSMDDPKIFGQGVYKDDNQEGEQSSRQVRDQTIGLLADIALAFPDEPTSTEQGIAETQADTAQHRKSTEPAEYASRVLAVGDRKPLDEGTYGHALHEGSDERPSGKTGVPDPPHPLRLVAIFERHAAQDQARQHQQQRQIKRREQCRIDDREGPPEHNSDDDQPRLIAVPDRRDRAQHGMPSRFVASPAEEDTDTEIEPVEQHVME